MIECLAVFTYSACTVVVSEFLQFGTAVRVSLSYVGYFNLSIVFVTAVDSISIHEMFCLLIHEPISNSVVCSEGKHCRSARC